MSFDTVKLHFLTFVKKSCTISFDQLVFFLDQTAKTMGVAPYRALAAAKEACCGVEAVLRCEALAGSIMLAAAPAAPG